MEFQATTQEICPRLLPHNILDMNEYYANSISDTNNKHRLLET